MKKIRVLLCVAALLLVGFGASARFAHAALNFSDPTFQTIWQRTDEPVAQGNAGRSWTWGPTTLVNAPTSEPYNAAQRTVQYFDKGRMEVNDPAGDRHSLFFVTSGLLVTELVTGQRQDGTTLFTPFPNGPATIPVAGDPNTSANNFGNATAPTYATFKNLSAGLPLANGTAITTALANDGTTSTIVPPAAVKVVGAAYDTVTHHAMVDVFVTFQNQTGPIVSNGQTVQGPIYYGNPLFVFGHPISDPYWITTNVGGKATQVLVQLFERRVLTYTPGNKAPFQVEMGNVGQHYVTWRYATPAPIATGTGYTVGVFATGTAAFSHPDSIVVDGATVYIDYQNITAKDGSDNKTSTVVQYTATGQVVRTFPIVGHSDGLRLNPVTHQLWAISNEDGNPAFATIDPASGTVTPYTFPATPHGGGFDDVAFVNGLAFISASNPTLDKDGINTFPAVYSVVLQDATHTIHLTPVLMGNASATDVVTNTSVSLNLTDPDSMLVDPQGNLVVTSQGDSELLTVHNAGQANQTITRLVVGTQIDDSAWATTAHGRLFVVDGPKNVTYTLRATFTAGTLYTEAPSDSTVAGFVGTIDPKTGTLTPIALGFGSPTGLIFVPDTTQ